MKITERYVFFWGNSDIYSNWFKSKFEMDGIIFENSEQAMMYEKALLMNDQSSANEILKTRNPRVIKELGRAIKPWNQKLWDEQKFDIMVKVLTCKFKDPILAKQLLSTGIRIIVEASPYDKIWGIGMSENDEGVEDQSNWKGQNLLGEALMYVRQLITKSSLQAT